MTLLDSHRATQRLAPLFFNLNLTKMEASASIVTPKSALYGMAVTSKLVYGVTGRWSRGAAFTLLGFVGVAGQSAPS